MRAVCMRVASEMEAKQQIWGMISLCGYNEKYSIDGARVARMFELYHDSFKFTISWRAQKKDSTDASQELEILEEPTHVEWLAHSSSSTAAEAS